MEWRFLTPVSGVFYPALVVGAAVIGDALARRRCGGMGVLARRRRARWLAAVTPPRDAGGADAA